MKNSTLFFYGILGVPIAFLGFPLYIYLPPFYVEHIGLNIGIVGVVLLVARLIDMIADPFIGRFCDIYSSKFKIILISSVFLVISLYFLIKPISNSYFYLFIFSIITYISYSFVLIPYLSLNAVLGKNEFDNTKLSFSREIFIIFGVLLSLLLPYIFLVSNDSKKSLELLLSFVLIIFPIALILFYQKLKSLEIKSENIAHNTFFRSLKTLFKSYPNQKKLSLAFAIAISFITLEFTGFDKQNINEYSIFAIIFLYSTLPIVFKIFAIFFLNRYEMTK